MECGCRLWVGATDSSSLENYVCMYLLMYKYIHTVCGNQQNSPWKARASV